MEIPPTLNGSIDPLTPSCERILVTLLHGLGPWKKWVYLVGGLTPRYLVAARPPEVPAHADTLDVDIVIDLRMLANPEANRALEDNLKKMGFVPAENRVQHKQPWRWQARNMQGALTVLKLLADAPEHAGGRVQPLPTQGAIAALNIPHASIVFDLHQFIEIQAELVGGKGVVTETIQHANLVSFTCLKSFAFDQRLQGKDAHDLIYCLEYAPNGMDAVAQAFRHAREGQHGAVVEASLAILRSRFASEGKIEGYRKDGPIAVAKFELGEGDEPEEREARTLRQRNASDVIERLLAKIG